MDVYQSADHSCEQERLENPRTVIHLRPLSTPRRVLLTEVTGLAHHISMGGINMAGINKMNGNYRQLLLQTEKRGSLEAAPFLFPLAVALHTSPLAWKIPWTEEPGRLQSMGSLSQTRLSDFTFPFHFHALEKEMATHSSVLAWRIPGTAEPGGLLSMGLLGVRHD